MTYDEYGQPVRCVTYDVNSTDLDPSWIVYCPKDFHPKMEMVLMDSCPENEDLVGYCASVEEGIRLFLYLYARGEDADAVAAHGLQVCVNNRNTWHGREP